MTDGIYYNMMYTEGLPKKHLNSIKTCIALGERPKNIVIGVDDISFFVDPEWHLGQLYRLEFPFTGSLLEKARFYIRYLDSITTLQSLKTILAYQGHDTDKMKLYYTTGTEDLTFDIPFN